MTGLPFRLVNRYANYKGSWQKQSKRHLTTSIQSSEFVHRHALHFEMDVNAVENGTGDADYP